MEWVVFTVLVGGVLALDLGLPLAVTMVAIVLILSLSILISPRKTNKNQRSVAW